MAEFVPFEKGVEVNGQTVMGITAGVGAFKKLAEDILKENGIVDPQPDGWYSQEAWLNSFKQLADKMGERMLFKCGKSVPDNAQFPPQIQTIEDALGSLDVAYHMNHRGGEIGTYKFEKINDNSARLICENPYPCEFDRGLIDGLATKFKPAGTALVSVKHDPDSTCRKNGDNSCSYIVSW